MTPEVLAALAALVQQYGLPIVMLAGFGWVMFKRVLVTRGELDDKQDELDKMAALYERERHDRVAAEQMLLKVAPASAHLADAVTELSETVLKRLPMPADPYDERLEGSRRGR